MRCSGQEHALDRLQLENQNYSYELQYETHGSATVFTGWTLLRVVEQFYRNPSEDLEITLPGKS